MKTTIHNINTLRINHISWSILGIRLDKFKGHHSTIHHLFLFRNVIRRKWQKGLKEGSKPQGMSSHNHILLCHRGRKQKVTKEIHSFQSIGTNRFVATVQTHVDLIGKNVLKIANLGSFLHPRGMNLGMSGSNGKCVWVATYFLQDWNDEDLFLRPKTQGFEVQDGLWPVRDTIYSISPSCRHIHFI